MGLLDRAREQIGATFTRGLTMATPWGTPHPHHLEPIVMADILGTAPATIDRSTAIRIPSLSRARLLIVSTIPRLPLVTTNAAGEEIDSPAWLTKSTGPITPFHRMLWTIDDLFFYGWSLWAVERDHTGIVTDGTRIDYNRWAVDADGTITVDGAPAAADEVLLFPGVNEGILSYGADTLIEAANIARAIQKAAETPSAQIELHQTNDAQMTSEQVRNLISSWAKARRGENGGVAYTSSGIEVREHGAAKEHLLIEGRNAVAVDVARHAGIPAAMIDATLSGASITYQNTAARMAELVTFGLAPLMAAVSSRLSQDDVTPPGVTIDFDSTSVVEDLRPPTQNTNPLADELDDRKPNV